MMQADYLQMISLLLGALAVGMASGYLVAFFSKAIEKSVE